jgi:hypothetical protein
MWHRKCLSFKKKRILKLALLEAYLRIKGYEVPSLRLSAHTCGSLPREPPTGYPKPVSRKQHDKQDFHGNQQMQHVLLRAVFSLGSA